MPNNLVKREPVYTPQVLGRHYKPNVEATKKILMMLTNFGISDEEAHEIVRRSEEPKFQARLKGMIVQLLTVYYGMSPKQAEDFVNKYGYDEASFEEMVQAISNIRPGQRITTGLRNLLPKKESLDFMHESFLGGIIRIAEGMAQAIKLYVDTKKMPRATLNRLATKDPTPQKKYIEWMAKMYTKGQRSMGK